MLITVMLWCISIYISIFSAVANPISQIEGMSICVHYAERVKRNKLQYVWKHNFKRWREVKKIFIIDDLACNNFKFFPSPTFYIFYNIIWLHILLAEWRTLELSPDVNILWDKEWWEMLDTVQSDICLTFSWLFISSNAMFTACWFLSIHVHICQKDDYSMSVFITAGCASCHTAFWLHFRC